MTDNFIERLTLCIYIRKITTTNIEDFYNEKLNLWYYRNSDSFESIDGTNAIIRNGAEFDNYYNFIFSKTQKGFVLDESDFIKSEIQYLNSIEFKAKLTYSQTKQFEMYLNLLESKLFHTQQSETVKSKEAKHLHPKFDPNYWNNDCFELFKYLYDCYYTRTKRQLTNIWFYLKENGNPKYNLKATKEQYEFFILENYQIRITNFDKAQTKWEDKEYKTIEDHRINFEDTLK